MPKLPKTNAPSPAQIARYLAEARVKRDVRARRIAKEILGDLDQRTRLVHRIGTALAVISRERLWANLGHASFDSFLVDLGVGRSQAWKWIAIATSLSEDRAAELGVEAAYEATRTVRRRRRSS